MVQSGRYRLSPVAGLTWIAAACRSLKAHAVRGFPRLLIESQACGSTGPDRYRELFDCGFSRTLPQGS